jgi:hypothetical protein
VKQDLQMPQIPLKRILKNLSQIIGQMFET